MQLLPNGKQQFLYPNGSPLANGSVYFYSVGTLTPKDTYQDFAGTIPNTNPVTLDANGQAVIYGSGAYRQIVKDVGGVTIWDEPIYDPGYELASNLASTTTGKGASLVSFSLTSQSVEAGATQQVSSISVLRGISPVASRIIYLKTYATYGDGGEGFFRAATGAAPGTYVDNAGTIIVPTGGDGSAAWLRDYSGALNIRWFGAVGDWNGSTGTDDTTAIQNTINATQDKGIVYAPRGSYRFSSLTISKSLTIVGDGWYSSPNVYFGNAGWLDTTATIGTVFWSSATTGNAITASSTPEYLSLGLDGVAIVGPGSGTSIGLNIGNTTTASVRNIINNVLIANFATGLNWIHTYESEVRSMTLRGNSTDFTVPNFAGAGVFSDNHFYRCAFENSTVAGVSLSKASVVTFHGCLFQNNTATAVNLVPATSGGIEDILFNDGCWFENGTGKDFTFDSTAGGFKFVSIKNSRSSSTGGITFTGAGSIGRVTFHEYYAPNTALTIPAGATNIIIENCEFSSVTDNSSTKRSLVIDDTMPRCIGWMLFNGSTGASLYANNLTLTKIGTGTYELGFIAQKSADGGYAVCPSVKSTGIANNITLDVYTQTSTLFRFRTMNTATGLPIDSDQVGVAVFK